MVKFEWCGCFFRLKFELELFGPDLAIRKYRVGRHVSFNSAKVGVGSGSGVFGTGVEVGSINTTPSVVHATANSSISPDQTAAFNACLRTYLPMLGFQSLYCGKITILPDLSWAVSGARPAHSGA